MTRKTLNNAAEACGRTSIGLLITAGIVFLFGGSIKLGMDIHDRHNKNNN